MRSSRWEALPMPERNEFTTWPSRYIPDGRTQELSLSGWPLPVVVETPEEIHVRLGQSMILRQAAIYYHGCPLVYVTTLTEV